MARADEERFAYTPGQFAELSVFGKGEAPFGMASTPTRPGRLSFSVSKIGVVTGALHRMEKGDVVGVRGPFGNGYPLQTFKGKNLVLVGGGFRVFHAPVPDEFHSPRFKQKRVQRPHGDLRSKKAGMLLYKKDLEAWKSKGISGCI